ncbi:hypothetical protein ACFPIJ_47435 [Dactylosporangium cerinum]|uniref:Uncharacterized protein n=1 Tax=Dactylosporangium cerinum TaxID=1434730 RepID=A0ABV9WB51_9ACTN
MGNSAVYLIHTSDDLGKVYAMAQRLLATAPTCCQPEVGVYVETDSHDLDRYVGVAAIVCLSLDIPAYVVRQARAVLEPCLAPDDLPMSRRDDGGVHLATTLTVEMAAALRELPPMNAHVYPPDDPLPSTLADTFLALVNMEPAEISWMTCWPGVHHESGFQLGVNGAVLWHRPPPPGHSLYVHVPPAMPQLAEHLAAAVGGDILGEPALGW